MRTGLQDIYASAVASGAITADPAQIALLDEFETLRTFLEEKPKRGLRNMFSKTAEAPKSIYLWGGVGRGKSMLMDMFYEAVDAPKRRVHFHAFMQEIHAAMFEARKLGVEDALRPALDSIISDVRLLAFDEMQISDITDAMIVGRLFEGLIEAGVVIVTTSNRAPQELYKNGLNRALFLPFIEFLEARMSVQEIKSVVDYRQDKLAGSTVYFSPANADARASIDVIWQGLTSGDSIALNLTVNGRDVVVPKFNSGVARVDFWDLCGRPLGAADYLAIGQAVRVLIVEDVPRLSRSNFNEAKRFVTLIDALYEAKVRLIMSAADIPDRLYLEGEGSFEFERTASRLIEMQAAEWGVS